MGAALLFARANWKLVGLGLLALLLAVQTVRLGHRSNQLERAKIANNELRAELKAISDAKNTQKAETERRITETRRQIDEADKRAREIEEAPTQPDCKTPPEILKADI